MLVISADWISIIFLIFGDKANLRWIRSFNDSGFTYLAVLLAPLLAAILALALKGKARTSTVAACLCMAVVWAMSWNV